MAVDSGIRMQLARLSMLTGMKTLIAELQAEVREMEEQQQQQITQQPQLSLPKPPQGTPPTEDEREAMRLKQSKAMKKNWKLRKAAGLGKAGKLSDVTPLNNHHQPANPHKSRQPHIGFGTHAEWLYAFASEHDGVLNTKEARAEAANLGHSLGTAQRMSVIISDLKNKGLLKTSGPGESRLTPLAHNIWRKERKNNEREGKTQQATAAG